MKFKVHDIVKDINNYTNSLCPLDIVSANDYSTINVRHYTKKLMFPVSFTRGDEK